MKIVSATAAILTVANAVKPGSVEWDPRSADFGKIRIGDTRFDVTGGAGSLTTLAARLATLSSKSSSTKQVSKLNSGKYGATTGLDVVTDFLTNKASPLTGILISHLKGQDANGNKPTLKSDVTGSVTPIGIQGIKQNAQDPHAANPLITAIADGLGIAASTYGNTPDSQAAWKTSTSKEILSFKKAIGPLRFTKAANQYNQKLNDYMSNIVNDKGYKALSIEDQQSVITQEKAKIQKDVFQQNGFHYYTPRSSNNRLKRFVK